MRYSGWSPSFWPWAPPRSSPASPPSPTRRRQASWPTSMPGWCAAHQPGMEVGHEACRLLVGDGGDAGDERGGAQGQKDGDQPEYLITGEIRRPAGVAGRKDHLVRCRVQALQVVDGERSVVQSKRRELRVIGPEVTVRRDVCEPGALERGHDRVGGGSGAGQRPRRRIVPA